MLRKIASFFLSLIILSCLVLSVSAQTPYIVDRAGLLLPEEIASLEKQSAELAEEYGIHAVLLAVDSLESNTAQNYADDYYDNAGYGDNGVLFLLAMEEREWYISTCGTMIYALTDYSIQQIGESVVPYLAEEQWYAGFSCYLNMLPVYLDAYETGTPIDGYSDDTGDYYHGDQEEILYYEEEFTPNFLISLLCGVVIGGVSVLIMGLSMNSKRPQRCANEYMIDGSWKLTQHQDLFLYSNVTKTRKQEPPKNTGGGSSVHRSSGGRRHGGGGGKF